METNYNKRIAILASIIIVSFLILSQYLYFTTYDYILKGKVPAIFYMFYFWFYGGLILISGLAIFFILRRKRWALFLFQGLSVILLIFLIKPIFLISYVSPLGIAWIGLLGLTHYTVLLSAKRKVALEFGAKPKDKPPRKLFGLTSKQYLIIFLIFAIAFFGYCAIQYFFVFSKQKVYAMPKPSVFEGVSVKRYFIQDYSMLLPDDLKVTSIWRDKYQEKYYITLEDEDDKKFLSFNLNLGYPIIHMPHLGFKGTYGLTRRTTRIARIVFQFIPLEGFKRFALTEVKINPNYDGFFLQVEVEEVKSGYMYNLYDIRDRSREGHILIRDNENELTQEQWEAVMYYLKLNDQPPESEEYYYGNAKTNVKKKNYEEAKFDLVNALFYNWDNADYHHLLGVAFHETEDHESARDSLEVAKKLDPQNSDVKALLAEVEEKIKYLEEEEKKEESQDVSSN